jgi:hypothetical protein
MAHEDEPGDIAGFLVRDALLRVRGVIGRFGDPLVQRPEPSEVQLGGQRKTCSAVGESAKSDARA